MVMIFVRNCAIRQHTADGVPVGRCYHLLQDGRCPLHGDVRRAQERFLREGTMTNDYDHDEKEDARA